MSGWWWWAVRQGEGCTAVSDGRHGADGSGLESGQRTAEAVQMTGPRPLGEEEAVM